MAIVEAVTEVEAIVANQKVVDGLIMSTNMKNLIVRNRYMWDTDQEL